MGFGGCLNGLVVVEKWEVREVFQVDVPLSDSASG